MKRFILVQMLIFCLVLIGLNNSVQAGMYLPYGMDYGVGWFDANKTFSNTEDDLMCWAASASNILAWGGWTTPTYSSEDAIWQNFQDHWTDQGGLQMYGWEWWLTGVNQSQGWSGWSQVDVPGGGNHFPGLTFANYFQREWRDNLAMQAIDNYLHAGLGVGIGIYGPGGHALTAWGYMYDDVTGDYTHLIFTDSDDYMSSTGLTRNLWASPVNYNSGKWYLGGSSWYIGEVEGLAPNPIPEPNTIILLSFGMLGIFVYRFKRKNKCDA